MASIYKETVSIPKLKGSVNYATWKSQIKAVLDTTDTWAHVEGTADAPAPLMPTITGSDATADVMLLKEWKKEQSEWRKDRAKAAAIIFLNCDVEIQAFFDDYKSDPMLLWQAIEGQYAEQGFNFVYNVFTTFAKLKYEDCKSVEVYCQRFRTAMRQLVELDAALPNTILVCMFLGGLGHQFETWTSRKRSEIRAFRTKAGKVGGITTDITTLMAEITDEARDEEISKGLFHKKNQTNQAKGKGKEKQSTDSAKDDGQKKDNTMPPTRNGVKKCPHCKWGYHESSDCWTKHPEKAPEWQKLKIKEQKKQRSKSANKDDASDDEKPRPQGQGARALAVIATDPQAMVHITNPISEWVVDTGATDHMAADRSLFTNLTPVNKVVQQGKGQIEVLGIGSIFMKWILTDGSTEEVELKDVLYMPDLFTNLVSVPRLHRNGYYFHTGKGTVNHRKTDEEIGSTTFSSAVWLLNWQRSKPQEESIALPAVSIETWHQRFGHSGYSNLKETAKIVNGMELVKQSDVCDPCNTSKSHRQVSTRPPTHAAKAVFDCVSTDVVGPLNPTGIRGYSWVTTMVDEYTKVKWAYLQHRKGNTFESFKTFNAMVKNQTGKSIRRIKLDNGKEYGGNAFLEYCKDEGIMVETTVAYTPEQNGAAERNQAVVLMKARTMLYESRLPLFLWPEAYLTAVYIMNRSKTAIDKTPYEALNISLGFTEEGPPDVTNLRAFGCKAWIHLPQERRIQSEKLAVRAQHGYLVGYKASNVYKIWVPEEHKVVESSHVTFDEQSFNMDESNTELGPILDLEDLLRSSPSEGATARKLTDFNRGGLLEDHEDNIGPDPDHHGDEQAPAPPTPPVEARKNRQKKDNGPPTRRSARIAQPSAKARANMEEENDVDELSLNLQARQVVGKAFFTAAAVNQEDPKTLREALASTNKDEWMKACLTELDDLKRNGTYRLEPLPPGYRALDGKWVFKTKKDANGDITRFKARWVVKGFLQKEGVDFFETFAAVVKAPSFKLVFALIALYDLECAQMDMVTAFLNPILKEKVYVVQPTGFEEDKELVCRLQKTLYGLKQSPRYWYETLRAFLLTAGFISLESDHCVFAGYNGDVLILVYVDDLLIIGPSKQSVQTIKDVLNHHFAMKDLGPVGHFLGIRVTRNRDKGSIRLSQDAYVDKILKDFNYEECRSVSTPMKKGDVLEPAPAGYQAERKLLTWYQSLVGSALYLMTQTRADLAYTMGVLTRFCHNPTEAHKLAGIRLLRYLKGTRDAYIEYRFDAEDVDLGLQCFTDSDWAGDLETRRSTSGYVIICGGGPLVWQSGLQKTVALSSCEAEFYGITNATKEVIWIQSLLTEFKYQGADLIPFKLYEDNRAAIELAKNPEYHKRVKHVGIKWYFCRSAQKEGLIDVQYVSTTENAADGLTKVLNSVQHQRFCLLIGLKGITNKRVQEG